MDDNNNGQVLDDIVDGLTQNELVLEEEEKITLDKIESIKQQLKDKKLSRQEFFDLQRELHITYMHFMHVAKEVLHNNTLLIQDVKLIDTRNQLEEEINQ
jgi:hypothetical protein